MVSAAAQRPLGGSKPIISKPRRRDAFQKGNPYEQNLTDSRRNKEDSGLISKCQNIAAEAAEEDIWMRSPVMKVIGVLLIV